MSYTLHTDIKTGFRGNPDRLHVTPLRRGARTRDPGHGDITPGVIVSECASAHVSKLYMKFTLDEISYVKVT